MSVKIRLTRMGKKKQPSYRVVVVDSRKPRDGAYLEQIGRYDPRAEPSLVEIDNERALDWLQKGAQPTERAKKLLEISGAWTRFAIDRGEIHTVGTAATAPEPTAAPEPAPEPTPEPLAVVEAEEEPAEEPAAEPAAEDSADDSSEKVDE
ncbi:MAG: 30S ribosomal protein S16 [bacterium]|nr:30S ribosomal protein S16 [bacterium]